MKRVVILAKHINAPGSYLSTAVELVAEGDGLVSMMDDGLYSLSVVILECSSAIVIVGNQAATTYSVRAGMVLIVVLVMVMEVKEVRLLKLFHITCRFTKRS